jgi:antirestriction protein
MIEQAMKMDQAWYRGKQEPSGPRIYVACLAAYNGGRLHGAWIDADQDAKAIWSEVQAMLKASPDPGAEEWAIHDYEGFEGIRISESESFEHVAEHAEMIEKHGAAWGAWVANGMEASEALFCEHYNGEWDSERDFAENLAHDLGYTDEAGNPCCAHDGTNPLLNYIDWEAWTRDLFMGDYWSARTGSAVCVFWNC